MAAASFQNEGGDQGDSFLPTRRSLLSRLGNLEDNDSWREFFETYWKLIYNAAIKAGLSDAEAQDVVQETVLTVSRNIGRFDYDPDVGSFKGWLLKTTRWKILDQLRRRNHDLQRHVQPDAAGGQDLISQVPDPAGNKLDEMWEREWQLNLLDAAMRRIKRQVRPKHFQVFELSCLKNWPPGKVGAALGINIAQVYLIKHRVSALVEKEVRRLQEKCV